MNRPRTTHAILAIIAFLLAAHLAVWLSGNEAHAQQPPFNSAEPTVVGVSAEQIWAFGSPTKSWKIVRAWSDGQVDTAQVLFDSFFGNEVAFVHPPVVVIDPGP